MHIEVSTVVEVVIPAVTLIYYAGKNSQVLKQLKTITEDHETRLRKAGL